MNPVITTIDYFRAYEGHAEITPEIHENAAEMLSRVNNLLAECAAAGWEPANNPATRSLISGNQNGGWRPQATTVGSPGSSHKQGRGVDVADADNTLDAMVDNAMLEAHGLYREDPLDTLNWVHLTDRAPPSGRRTFKP